MGVDWNLLAQETAFVIAEMKAENVFGYCSCHNWERIEPVDLHALGAHQHRAAIIRIFESNGDHIAWRKHNLWTINHLVEERPLKKKKLVLRPDNWVHADIQNIELCPTTPYSQQSESCWLSQLSFTIPECYEYNSRKVNRMDWLKTQSLLKSYPIFKVLDITAVTDKVIVFWVLIVKWHPVESQSNNDLLLRFSASYEKRLFAAIWLTNAGRFESFYLFIYFCFLLK